MHVFLRSVARLRGRVTTGPAAQIEMPNRTSFSEVRAARMPAFGDSAVIEIVKIDRTN
ncbi:hypothetical protein [Bradyrhizobium yuanmingense]|uniref:hypothetical protein n=1 Tax=Bradyrhizobium yuanmingense TaxID=108015 RepID=UPI0023B9C86D|nr:hypothetical protein [Bradyrhizobium yuanmingense]MDF0584100.1 hypothetical protein [Bradyrhizobium yuanmingense]